MALINSFEKSGNLLFRYRGQLPIVLFVMAVAFIYFTGDGNLSESNQVIVGLISVVISFLGFVIRAIAIATTPKGTSGRNTKEGQVADSLNTTGIYSMVRHPLYLGNYLMWIGIVLFTFNFYFVIIVSLLYWIYYERIMFAEERFLERKFGDEYMNWANGIPAFLPSFKKYQPNVVPFSFKSILRREYSGMLATVIGFVFVDDLRRYFTTDAFELNTTGHQVLLVALVIVLILRSLKHYTRALDEKNRS